MRIEVMLFGQLSEIAGSGSIIVDGVNDTNDVIRALGHQFPAMNDIKYIVAVNRKTTRENTVLASNSQVALLPPFSGG